MAGRIREEDIAEVREKTRIDEVISQYVTLRSAGGGSSKGLCPFHDEKTPSFNVNPSRGYYHCFGCAEGGDVISFLMKIDGLSFTETVERLADSVGVQLRYEEGGPERPTGGPRRPRLLEAHKLAQAYYADLLAAPEALAARQFLASRGFDQAAAETFGVGFSPRGGEDLHRHLRQYSFTDEELVTAGLVGQSQRGGHYDRFRGRLMWPIRDTSGATIGFGARRIFDDDRIEAKYLNTPETPIYKKSQVLYGVDLARQAISRTSQAVVVEGYTDVMACHLSGVQTAVASCGTAFGEEHTRLLRRLLHDHEEFRGEVIFTFDGDQAGQDAAMKAFGGDQRFVSQTYVAVEPDGLDPCDLRLQKGEEAVRELVARRQPLYRFVLGNVVRRFDLDRADGRVDALREGAKLVTSIRDRSKVDAFVRELAGMVGIDPDDARREVRRITDRRSHRGPGADLPSPRPASRPDDGGLPTPDPRDPRLAIERETLKLLLQHPHLVAPAAGDIDADDFRHPAHRALWEIVTRLGGPAAARPSWVADLAAATQEPVLRGLISSLAVEPINAAREPDTGYAAQHVYRLQELTVQRRIADLKSRLQRSTPGDAEYNRTFGELVALEQQRRSLRELAVGGA
ncbi:DNA primase [Nocardioides mangrovicus]|uniref:DNA primase n=1 Tax=Nocardioides mangrovicus TaxID=2478913 RepID=A0A3L8P208_9ACTN|nr:DNA primase [Nocardioides mangrovicus]RLV48997.1 DNA primase [Nocardioides mangrovicus]